MIGAILDDVAVFFLRAKYHRCKRHFLLLGPVSLIAGRTKDINDMYTKYEMNL